MAQASAAVQRRGFLATLRTDRWWVEPWLVFFALAVLFGWLTLSIFLNAWAFEIGPYLSPVYEPKLWDSTKFYLSPAFIILLGPVPFRATCYYYRRAYYRSFLLSPPACAVGDVAQSYTGESRFPLILQNVHRFFMYAALVWIFFLWWGAFHGFRHPDEGWGVGVGSILLVINAFLLMMYTLSCHSLRHFVGGGLDCFSCSRWAQSRKRVWDYVSLWNERHRMWAWTSLIVIAFVDIYIRLVANGHITDINTWASF